jgi:NAD(P)-dependent dehydrogenase (short-subunit alcohol dehydrogenase family)
LAATPAEALLDVPAIRGLLNADGDTADTRSMAYGIAKRGNQLRVQAAASRWGARGARINSISPGVISTAMGRAELADPATGEMVSAMIAGSPTGRVGTVGDIAAIAEFLLSIGAGFITGTDVLADGGVVASMLTLQLPVPA